MEFMHKYDKVYVDSAQFVKRFRIYVNNMANIDALNERNYGRSIIYGENQFADWSEDEFRQVSTTVND
uniref:Inhibitor_I29 domain-containing protein n=1 Tax=Ascaris lumbricoides TaxID=6252 RepID=A0A0M3IVA2_ASCLU